MPMVPRGAMRRTISAIHRVSVEMVDGAEGAANLNLRAIAVMDGTRIRIKEAPRLGLQ